MLEAIKEFFKASDVAGKYPYYTFKTEEGKKYMLQLIFYDNATLQSEGDHLGLLYEVEHKTIASRRTLLEVETIGALVNTYHIESIGGEWTYNIKKTDVMWIDRVLKSEV